MMHRREAGQVIYYFSSKPFVVISSPPWFLLETDMNRFTGPFLQISLSTPIPHLPYICSNWKVLVTVRSNCEATA